MPLDGRACRTRVQQLAQERGGGHRERTAQGGTARARLHVAGRRRKVPRACRRSAGGRPPGVFRAGREAAFCIRGFFARARRGDFVRRFAARRDRVGSVDIGRTCGRTRTQIRCKIHRFLRCGCAHRGRRFDRFRSRVRREPIRQGRRRLSQLPFDARRILRVLARAVRGKDRVSARFRQGRLVRGVHAGRGDCAARRGHASIRSAQGGGAQGRGRQDAVCGTSIAQGERRGVGVQFGRIPDQSDLRRRSRTRSFCATA